MFLIDFDQTNGMFSYRIWGKDMHNSNMMSQTSLFSALKAVMYTSEELSELIILSFISFSYINFRKMSSTPDQ